MQHAGCGSTSHEISECTNREKTSGRIAATIDSVSLATTSASVGTPWGLGTRCSRGRAPFAAKWGTSRLLAKHLSALGALWGLKVLSEFLSRGDIGGPCSSPGHPHERQVEVPNGPQQERRQDLLGSCCQNVGQRHSCTCMTNEQTDRGRVHGESK